MPTIQLPADILFTIGSVPVSNAVFTAFVITALFLLFAILATRDWGMVPTRLQLVFELMIDWLMGTLEEAYGSERMARRFFPLIATLMLFIGVANQFALVPLVAEVTVNGTDLFRVPTSVLGGTIALSVMVMALAQLLALYASPLGYIGKFIRLGPLMRARSLGGLANGLLEIFLGALDLIGEIAKVVSLGARLFGNVFAGQVMVAVIAALSTYTQFIVPVPFLVISIFSGLVQTLVFVLLTTQFIGASLATAKETEETGTPAPVREEAAASA